MGVGTLKGLFKSRIFASTSLGPVGLLASSLATGKGAASSFSSWTSRGASHCPGLELPQIHSQISWRASFNDSSLSLLSASCFWYSLAWASLAGKAAAALAAKEKLISCAALASCSACRCSMARCSVALSRDRRLKVAASASICSCGRANSSSSAPRRCSHKKLPTPSTAIASKSLLSAGRFFSETVAAVKREHSAPVSRRCCCKAAKHSHHSSSQLQRPWAMHSKRF
mmetsp:Transcript_58385/g.92430  ORF Transcript_58385/g.92430 Transcript_58385/m.92430 type:complete len:228 (-) Transcript_58385:864-1547(-)